MKKTASEEDEHMPIHLLPKTNIISLLSNLMPVGLHHSPLVSLPEPILHSTPQCPTCPVSWNLEPYDIELKAGGGGADIGPLKPNAGVLMGLRPDSSRYFDFHHSALDVLENVHPRELAAGAAALTSLVFLLDQYGIGK
jgi:hypothetical protein